LKNPKLRRTVARVTSLQQAALVGGIKMEDLVNRLRKAVGLVLADLHNLPLDAIYELIAPFYPAPLIDKASGIGFVYYVVEVNPEEYRVYFKNCRDRYIRLCRLCSVSP
jgi:hypothetical protein